MSFRPPTLMDIRSGRVRLLLRGAAVFFVTITLTPTSGWGQTTLDWHVIGGGGGDGLDVDGDGVVQVATDIVYIARQLLVLTPVPPSFRATHPTIPPDDDITNAIGVLCPP